MGNTAIEWTDKTWNCVAGCTKLSPGCSRCYAETMAFRLRGMALADLAAGRDPGRKRAYLDAVGENGRWTGRLVPVPEALEDPSRWRKPCRIFVNSMSDLLHESLDRDFILRVFMAMRREARHTFQVLTKRAGRMRDLLRRWLPAAEALADTTLVIKSPAPNVWLGVSVEDQRRADERVPLLLDTPAAVRFLSCEPLLGPLDLTPWLCGAAPSRLHWVIVGGESGPGARPMDSAWALGVIRQCREAGVACFVKQAGSAAARAGGMKDPKGGDPAEWDPALRVREFPVAG